MPFRQCPPPPHAWHSMQHNTSIYTLKCKLCRFRYIGAVLFMLLDNFSFVLENHIHSNGTLLFRRYNAPATASCFNCISSMQNRINIPKIESTAAHRNLSYEIGNLFLCQQERRKWKVKREEIKKQIERRRERKKAEEIRLDFFLAMHNVYPFAQLNSLKQTHFSWNETNFSSHRETCSIRIEALCFVSLIFPVYS